MAIEGFSPPSPSSPSPPHCPYYQLLEHGSARLGRVKKSILIHHLRFTPKKCVKVAQKLENVEKNPGYSQRLG